MTCPFSKKNNNDNHDCHFMKLEMILNTCLMPTHFIYHTFSDTYGTGGEVTINSLPGQRPMPCCNYIWILTLKFNNHSYLTYLNSSLGTTTCDNHVYQMALLSLFRHVFGPLKKAFWFQFCNEKRSFMQGGRSSSHQNQCPVQFAYVLRSRVRGTADRI